LKFPISEYNGASIIAQPQTDIQQQIVSAPSNSAKDAMNGAAAAVSSNPTNTGRVIKDVQGVTSNATPPSTLFAEVTPSLKDIYPRENKPTNSSPEDGGREGRQTDDLIGPPMDSIDLEGPINASSKRTIADGMER
jgi:hypothetical protein